MQPFTRIVIVTLVLLAISSVATRADVPGGMNVSGRLADTAGNAAAPGPKDFTFKIFDSEIGGTEVWPAGLGEDQTITTDQNGLWNAYVGAVVPLSAFHFQDTSRWLEITVDDGVNPPETLPRTRLVTTPFAYRVATVDGADGGIIIGDVTVLGDLDVPGKATIGPGHTNTGSWAFTAGQSNTASGNEATVGGGRENVASGGIATVGGGWRNEATNDLATIGGGDDNVASGLYTTIAGGRQNVVGGAYSAILGGYADTIGSGSDYSYLFGVGSRLSGDSTFMVDMPHIRFGDMASGYEFPAVDGSSGQVMQTDGSGQLSWNTVSGGGGSDTDWALTGNVLFTGGQWGIARGGAENALLGDSTHHMVNLGSACTTGVTGDDYKGQTIGGGVANVATSHYATVSGGAGNRAAGYCAVSGGLWNSAELSFSTIAGGQSNTAGQQYATVGGGFENTASGLWSTIPGGRNNTAFGDRSFAAGAYASAMDPNSFVWSDGTMLSTTGVNQFLIAASGGVGIATNAPQEPLHVDGTIYSSSGGFRFPDSTVQTTAASGGNWSVADTVLYTNDYWGIARGQANNILQGDSTQTQVNLGVACTTGYSASFFSHQTVGGGYENAAKGKYSTVAGGEGNRAVSTHTTVSGGIRNYASGSYATVGGGAYDSASNAGATVGGGELNKARGQYSTVSGGQVNDAHVNYATIAGGHSNDVWGEYATVAGGRDNLADADYSTVGGGYVDSVYALYGTVGGGLLNQAGYSVSDTAAVVGGGANNTAGQRYATVSGGQSNAALAIYSSVLGGRTNVNSGQYSTILGGWSNSVQATASYSLAFGRNVSVSNSYIVNFFDGSLPGRFGLNRDVGDGGILYPIHVGTNAGNGNSARLTAGGVWTSTSGRATKENFQAIDGQELLSRISTMPVNAWNYIGSDERHIGPVAEDFVAAFDVGSMREGDNRREDRYLSALDVAGVALMGVQELYDMTLQRQNVAAELQEATEALTAKTQEIEQLQSQVAQLQAAVNGLLARETANRATDGN